MNQLTMPQVLQKISYLPSLPLVVMELLTSLDKESTDVTTLAESIGLDQTLTAQTLRLANSSFYGMAREVTTIAQAIAILGFRTIRSLATTAAFLNSLPHAQESAFELSTFWRHCIAVAVCARELAPVMEVNSEQAYTAGLLHDIGRLVLATQFPSQFDAVLSHRTTQHCTLTEAEMAVLGLDHTAVGQALTQHWNFPVALQQTVAVHHAAPRPGEIPLATAVRAADRLVHALEGAPLAGSELSPSIVQIGIELGLERSAWKRTVTKIGEDCFSASAAFVL